MSTDNKKYDDDVTDIGDELVKGSADFIKNKKNQKEYAKFKF